MEAPKELHYSKDHEWIRVEGEIGTIGITNYAQNELGDVVFVELPTVGDNLRAGDSFGSLESVKAVSEVYIPIDGEIVEVNADLENGPEAVNEAPYDAGWMVKVRLTNPSQIDKLMSSEAYTEFVAAE